MQRILTTHWRRFWASIDQECLNCTFGAAGDDKNHLLLLMSILLAIMDCYSKCFLLFEGEREQGERESVLVA